MNTPTLDEQGRKLVRVHLAAARESLRQAEHAAGDQEFVQTRIEETRQKVESLWAEMR